ncbi:hypothetical protein IQ268_31490 [Oculatella sp. LEGE 06141]|uniref:hypothetical protein n=1 Tax=Oculatella sp. LEGE 06141 TaxID=1828648 RepID=UPI0018816C25|nr:hypothetical protein [Oculatella sp. LEGE 06141]MBE9183061.1 hypothetical protein [Oculatella sp. LEGE 06141]
MARSTSQKAAFALNAIAITVAIALVSGHFRLNLRLISQGSPQPIVQIQWSHFGQVKP